MHHAYFLVPLALTPGFGISAPAQDAMQNGAIPTSMGKWLAEGKPFTYDRKTVFDYLDGGAEVYLAYGMKNVRALRYTSPGEPSIELSIFEMEEPAGAFGIFTYERLDDEAGIGQESEYGGGMLRFWQGKYFVFVQTELEKPASRDAVLALGRDVASRLGTDASHPYLHGVLPKQGLRPLSERYVLSPLTLKNLESTLNDNLLGLPQHAPAVMGRYGTPGNPERILVVLFPDEKAAQKGITSYLKLRCGQSHMPTVPFQCDTGWNLIAALGNHGVLILDGADEARVRKHFEEITLKLMELSR
jgi:hypothetical protein